MTETREIEAKFEADEDTLTTLLTLNRFGGFTLSGREQAIQNDTYFDTGERHLRRAGATLRIRQRTSGARLTFKGDRQAAGESNVSSRLEDEVELDATAITGLDDYAALDIDGEVTPMKRARNLTGDATLLPTARFVTNRTVLDYVDSHGTRVEVSVDRCEATRLNDGRVVRFSEVELELKRGDPGNLLDAARKLQQMLPGLKPSNATKLQRALE